MSQACDKEGDLNDTRSSPQHNPGTSQNNQDHSGDPVNLVTGAFTLDESDVSFPCQCLMLELTRHYDCLQHNQAQAPGPFGWGWTHSYNLYLEGDPSSPSGEMRYVDDHGTQIAFAKDSATGQYVAPPGALGLELTTEPGAGYRLRQVEGLLAEFDLQGRIVALVRPGPARDSRLDLSYDGEGRLCKVQGAGGRGLSFSYDGTSPLVRSVADHTGRRWRYRYDQYSNLTEVRDPAGRLRRYTYDRQEVEVAALREGQDKVELKKQAVLGLYQVFAWCREGNASAAVAEVTNQYTSEFRIAHQVDALGGVTRFDHNRFARTTAITDPAGWTTLYCYDQQGNTTKVRTPEGGTTEFIYDDKRNLIAEIDPLGQRTEYADLQDPDRFFARQAELGRRAVGNRSDYVTVQPQDLVAGYDRDGNRPLVRDALRNTTRYFGYTRFGKPRRVSLPDGGEVRIQYDDRSGLALRIEQDLVAGRSQPLCRVRKWTYDDWGNAVRQEEYATSEGGTAGPRRIVVQGFDDLGHNMVSRRVWIDGSTGQAPFCSEEEFEWDDLGRLLSRRVLRRSFPQADAQSLVTRWGYDVLGRTVWELAPDGTAQCFERDVQGQVVEAYMVESADPQRLANVPLDRRRNREQWSYDLRGNPQQYRDPSGAVTTRHYDSRGLCTSVIEPTSYTTSFEYDRDGHEVRRRTNTGYEMSSTYDMAGRLVAQNDSAGLETVRAYDALGRIVCETENSGSLASETSCSYDMRGRLTDVCYADGAYECMTYDERDLLIRRERGPVPTSLEVYEYDGLGRLDTIRAGSPGHLRTLFSYRYDDALRVVESSDALGNRTRSLFDTAGNLVRIEDAEGRSLALEYDGKGRLVRRQARDGSVAADYAYDFGDRLIEAREGEIVYRWEHDACGRVVTHHQQVGQQVRRIQYRFDKAGRLVEKEAGDDWWMKYEYRPESPFLSQVAIPGNTIGVESDAVGRVRSESWDDGGQSLYEYLPNGLLYRKRSLAGDGRLIFGQDFTFDARQRPVSEGRRLGEHCTEYYYSYDHLDRLRQVDTGNADSRREFHRYEYDVLGNRLEEYREGKLFGAWRYDAANRLLQAWDAAGDVIAYEYDRCGNMTRRGEQLLTYDAARRLRMVLGKETTCPLLEYAYSATDQRALIVRGDAREWVVFDDANQALSVSRDRTQAALWGFEVDMLLAATGEDGACPVRVVTSSLNSVIGTPGSQSFADYDPYGNAIDGKSGALQFGFGGKRYESVIGLYDNRARHYDPLLGRFIQPDPLGSFDSINLYQFAQNNPLVYFDMDGHVSQKNAQGKIAEPSGKYYSVLFEVALPPSALSLSDYHHFKLANEAFIHALRASSSYEALVNQLLPDPIRQAQRAMTRHGAPEGWVWHHESTRAGVMQLVPKSQHTPSSIFWETMHPGRKGGYSNWAIAAGAPRR